MDAKIFLPLPNLLSMFHPFLPPHRLPEGTIHGSAWMLEEGNTPILHKDSNPRQRDGQQRIEKTDKQKGRVRGEGGKKKKDMRRGLRRPPLPHLHPHQHAGGMMGIKRGVKTERRTEDRGGKMKGRESALTKQTPTPPARDWHLVTVTSSSRPPSHSTDTQMNQPWRRLHRALSSLHRVTFHQRSP